jgi:hypothetical protein
LWTDLSQLWASFGEWYKQLFGEGGLVNAEMLVVQDGQTTLDEVKLEIRGMPDDYLATDLFRDIPTQLNLIGDWINEKFGASIIAESCRIC